MDNFHDKKRRFEGESNRLLAATSYAAAFALSAGFLLNVLRMNGTTQRSKPYVPALNPAAKMMKPKKMSVGL